MKAAQHNTVDPLAGSYYVEALTNEVEAAAWKLIEKIDVWAVL